jgi:hypothetical protein
MNTLDSKLVRKFHWEKFNTPTDISDWFERSREHVYEITSILIDPVTNKYIVFYFEAMEDRDGTLVDFQSYTGTRN